MAETDNPANAGAAAPENATGQAAQPTIQIINQFIRDLSFENPEAPASLAASASSPQFNVGINVGVKKQDDANYTIELSINAKAERDGKAMFTLELIYGGVFRVQNVPDNQLPLVLMIECPRLIFPFARQVIANVTQSGGFPPMLMEPVDFAAIYRQNLQRMAAAAQQQQQDANKDGDNPVN